MVQRLVTMDVGTNKMCCRSAIFQSEDDAFLEKHALCLKIFDLFQGGHAVCTNQITYLHLKYYQNNLIGQHVRFLISELFLCRMMPVFQRRCSKKREATSRATSPTAARNSPLPKSGGHRQDQMFVA